MMEKKRIELQKAKKKMTELKEEYATMNVLKDYVLAIDIVLKELEQLERENNIKDGYLELIHGLSYDYDGCTTVKSLKKLIDELDDLTVKALKNDDKSVMYWTAVDLKKGIERGKNILFEEVELERNNFGDKK